MSFLALAAIFVIFMRLRALESARGPDLSPPREKPYHGPSLLTCMLAVVGIWALFCVLTLFH